MSSPAAFGRDSDSTAGSYVARILECVLRTSGLSVWPHTTDRRRYAEQREVLQREGGHELQAVFGDGADFAARRAIYGPR